MESLTEIGHAMFIIICAAALVIFIETLFPTAFLNTVVVSIAIVVYGITGIVSVWSTLFRVLRMPYRRVRSERTAPTPGQVWYTWKGTFWCKVIAIDDESVTFEHVVDYDMRTIAVPRVEWDAMVKSMFIYIAE